ncbi:FUSC family protein [Arthrobacter sp. AQ5-05]|uniref:FUSC family protein n=1 Tax=Arthrobacter sp. AQ5-05 TaxID=2184581 RepID=UPI000DCF04B9|nr:FUSC family protein [Arthrobacter sp. AQ5-05]RAX49196.1 FUSC family protein [Arthrobacter sp. AQ5-05]
MGIGSSVSGAWAFVQRRNRVGLRRVGTSFPKVIQMTASAVLAYWIAEQLLGHDAPIFAATSGLLVLGFGTQTTVRRSLEVAIGCTLGVAVGDLLLTLLGSGLWQAGLVLFLSLMIARFLDSGPIFTTQLGLQSVLVVLLPIGAAGPFSRSLDAVVGSLCGLLIVMIFPRDPRRTPMAELGKLLGELSGVLQECGRAVSTSDSTLAFHALVRARGTQHLMDSLPAALNLAREVATLAPAHRRHRQDLERLKVAADKTDLAVRNSRVLARRLTTVINHGALTDRGVEAVSGLLTELSEAVDAFGYAVLETNESGYRKAVGRAKRELAECAARLDPTSLQVSGMQGEGMVLLLRPLVVDLLEATGTSHEDAVALMPRL